MTKRKASTPSATALAPSPQTVGGRPLVGCPVCGGFGGVQGKDEGDWKVCPKCKGGGKVWQTEATP
jgi:DnaJ-class molecular chaperone